MTTKRMQEHELKLKAYMESVKQREEEVRQMVENTPSRLSRKRNLKNNKVQFRVGLIKSKLNS